jgi:excisionase family DNA binding protein
MAQNVRLNGIKDIVARSGLSRSTIYGEMDSGRLQSVKVGSRRLIPESAFIDFIDNLIGASTQGVGSDSPAPQVVAAQQTSNQEMVIS